MPNPHPRWRQILNECDCSACEGALAHIAQLEARIADLELAAIPTRQHSDESWRHKVAELERDKARVDGMADMRIVDGIGGEDIDEMTLDSLEQRYGGCSCDESTWADEWRIQFRKAIDAAIAAQEQKKPKMAKTRGNIEREK